jgi:hypothetical protein
MNPMPATLHNVKCEACSEHHTLCFPRADSLDAWRSYEYECPNAKQTVELPLAVAGNRPINQRVRGALILRQVV